MALPKPATKPDWTVGNPSPGTIRVEPSVAKKQAGWFPDERPPSEFFNWLFFNLDEWVDYLESITDEIVGLTALFDAYVGSGVLATHANLQDAHDDGAIVPGSRILVLDSEALDSTVLLTKAELHIEFKPNVTYSKGGGAPTIGISVGASAHGTRILWGRFAGFSGGGEAAIDVNVAANYVMLRDMRFSNNTSDVEDNGNTTLSSEGHITE